jgi:hypothetical protein
VCSDGRPGAAGLGGCSPSTAPDTQPMIHAGRVFPGTGFRPPGSRRLFFSGFDAGLCPPPCHLRSRLKPAKRGPTLCVQVQSLDFAPQAGKAGPTFEHTLPLAGPAYTMAPRLLAAPHPGYQPKLPPFAVTKGTASTSRAAGASLPVSRYPSRRQHANLTRSPGETSR